MITIEEAQTRVDELIALGFISAHEGACLLDGFRSGRPDTFVFC